MATFDYTAAAGVAPVPYEPNSPFRLLKATLDFAKTPLSQAASDLAKVIAIKAGDFVYAVFAKLITAEGETMVVHVGDSVDPDGWLASFNVNGTPGTRTRNITTLTEGAPNTHTGYAVGKLYTADDYVGVTVATASGVANVAKIEIFALVARVG